MSLSKQSSTFKQSSHVRNASGLSHSYARQMTSENRSYRGMGDQMSGQKMSRQYQFLDDCYGDMTKGQFQIANNSNVKTSRVQSALGQRVNKIRLIARKVKMQELRCGSTMSTCHPSTAGGGPVKVKDFRDLTRNSSEQVFHQPRAFGSTRGSQDVPRAGIPGSIQKRGVTSRTVGESAYGEMNSATSGPRLATETQAGKTRSLKEMNEQALKSIRVEDSLGFDSVKSEAVMKAQKQTVKFNQILDELVEKQIQISNQNKLKTQQTMFSRRRTSGDNFSSISPKDDYNDTSNKLESSFNIEQNSTTTMMKSSIPTKRKSQPSKYRLYEEHLAPRQFIGKIDELGSVHQKKVSQEMNDRQQQLRFLVQTNKHVGKSQNRAASRKSSIKSLAKMGRASVVVKNQTTKPKQITKITQEIEMKPHGEVMKDLKKFRKATELKHQMEQLEQSDKKKKNFNRDKRESTRGDTNPDDDRGMSQNEYLALKQSLQASLQQMVPMTFDYVDYKVDEIEHRLAEIRSKEAVQEKTDERGLKTELDLKKREEGRSFLKQKKALLNHEKYEEKQAVFRQYSASKVGHTNLMKNGLIADSDNYRAKVEANKLIDLGSTLDEKYGNARCWELTLRHTFDETRKKQAKRPMTSKVGTRSGQSSRNAGQANSRTHEKPETDYTLELRQSTRSGLTSIHRDNRMQQIDIIRKTGCIPHAQLSIAQKEKLAATLEQQRQRLGPSACKNKCINFSRSSSTQEYLDANESSIYMEKHSQRGLMKNKFYKILPADLQQGHTLNSITDSVVLKFSDRPAKLKFHLPFSTRDSEDDEAKPIGDKDEKKKSMAEKDFLGPRYSEGNIMQLRLIGKNVFKLEKQAISKLKRSIRESTSCEPGLVLKYQESEPNITTKMNDLSHGAASRSTAGTAAVGSRQQPPPRPQQIMWMKNHALNEDLEGEDQSKRLK